MAPCTWVSSQQLVKSIFEKKRKKKTYMVFHITFIFIQKKLHFFHFPLTARCLKNGSYAVSILLSCSFSLHQGGGVSMFCLGIKERGKI